MTKLDSLMEKLREQDFTNSRSAKALEAARPYADIIKMLYEDKKLGWPRIRTILADEGHKLSQTAIRQVAIDAGVTPRPSPVRKKVAEGEPIAAEEAKPTPAASPPETDALNAERLRRAQAAKQAAAQQQRQAAAG